MPVPKYYCEYCNRKFNDTPSARQKHLQSKNHLRLRSLWYDSFKDARQLEEEYRQQGRIHEYRGVPNRQQLFPHIIERRKCIFLFGQLIQM